MGKLSAGLAHELNNPASAAKRATSQLRQILKRIKDASHELGRRELTPAQKAEIENLETSLIQRDEPPPDALSASDMEEKIDVLLRSHGQNDLWQLSADLARRGVKPAALESLFANLDADTARAALIRLAASVEVANLLKEIESSTTRSSDLVLAINTPASRHRRLPDSLGATAPTLLVVAKSNAARSRAQPLWPHRLPH